MHRLRSQDRKSNLQLTLLLDTNVISELRRPERANPRVVAWATSHPAADFFLSVITLLELELGVLRIERKDSQQGATLHTWLDHHVIARFESRTLPIDTAIAQHCARLHVPDPRAERDVLVAATALVHGMIVATRNLDDFVVCGVQTFNPWTASS
jgi:toxin FitB